MSDWDDDEGWEEEWDRRAEERASSRTWVVVLAGLLLVPLILGMAGAGGAITAAAPAFIAVAVFFGLVGGGYWLVSRWLGGKAQGDGPATWSDRR